MIKFGPSGQCDWFSENHSHSEEMPAWLVEHGLDVYEYAFNKGINISDEKAAKLGKLFKEASIELTVHGPYYINFANPSDEMADKSKMYVVNSLKKMKLMGATKLVVHPGSLMKGTREEAMNLVLRRLKELAALLDENDLHDMYVCFETMGKHGQVGTVEEIAQMCAIDKRYMPTLDFGHINAYTLGGLKTKEDFRQVFMTLKKYMGDRYKNVHIHFSKVVYGPKGELHHVNYNEDPDGYGPNFEPLAAVLREEGINATLVTESRGAQTEDAMLLKKIFNEMN